MEIELQCDDPHRLEDCGARFRVRGRADGGDGGGRSGDGGWRGSLQELSGGQRSLLTLSLLLAVAQHRPSMLLLMDEVDAALDESNAARVAALLKELSRTSQVIAISHRPELHRTADHIVRLHSERGCTVVAASP